MTTTERARSFLDYGRHVRGWSLRTIRTYRQSLTALPAMSVLDLSRAALQALVVSLRMRGLDTGRHQRPPSFDQQLLVVAKFKGTSQSGYEFGSYPIRPNR